MSEICRGIVGIFDVVMWGETTDHGGSVHVDGNEGKRRTTRETETDTIESTAAAADASTAGK